MSTKRRSDSSSFNGPKHYSVCGTTDQTRVDTSRVSVSRESTSNVPMWRSLSGIHASVISLDNFQTAGLQIIRPETHPEAFVPVPPDGGWGWLIVFAAFTTNLIIDGICVSFGIMANELVDHFEASVAMVMLIGSLLVGCYQIVGPVAAGLVNKFGCRAVGMMGALTATISMFASAFMPTIGLMLFSYGIVAGISFGLLHLPTIICVSFYFDSKRALAIGLTVCGPPIGAMIFAPLTELLLNRYGWSNTLILFSGMLLNCAVLAALYRPLVPALHLRPLTNTVDAEVIKSMLQMADTDHYVRSMDLHDQPILEEEEGEGETAVEKSTSPALTKTVEAEQEQRQDPKAVDANSPSEVTNASIIEEKDQVKGKTSEVDLEKRVTSDMENDETKDSIDGDDNKPFRRHSQALQQILDSFHLWRTPMPTKRRRNNKHFCEVSSTEDENDSFSDDDDDLSNKGWESDPGVVSNEEKSDSKSEKHRAVSVVVASHRKKGGDLESSTPPSALPWGLIDDEDANEARDQLLPMISSKRNRLHTTTSSSGGRSNLPPEIVITGQNGKREYIDGSRIKGRGVPSSKDCILSTPNLGVGASSARTEDWLGLKKGTRTRKYTIDPSSHRPSTQYPDSIRRTSVVHLAHLMPQRSISVNPRTPISFGSQFFSMHQSNASGIGGLGADREKESESPRNRSSVTEQELTGPVIVELPHESITIEDYARPMYRKDIFFHGNVKRQLPLENVLTSMGSTQDFISSKISIDGIRKRTVSSVGGGGGGAQFGSSILFGENVPLPPNVAAVPTEDDANWTGSCLMSLTKIPLPDVFKTTEEEEENAALWERVKQETGLYLTDAPADGIYRVPRSATLCGWWLCWKTKGMSHDGSYGEEEHKQHGGDQVRLWNIENEDKVVKRKKRRFQRKSVKLVLQRTCKFMPKSIWDVIATMLDLTLLKNKSFALLLLASLISTMGVYVPLFFVCDLAKSFNISKSQSSYLLTIYGGTSAVSRLLFAWAAGKPNTSPLIITIGTMMVCGVVVCLFPFLGCLWGQVALMAAYGFTISPYFSLISTILCDILDLEALTNAYGLVTMVRGISSTLGSPIAGMLVTATSSYQVAFMAAGGTILIGGGLYAIVAVIQRAKYKKMLNDVDEDI